MKKPFLLISLSFILFFTSVNISAQSVIGQWNSINPDNNKIESTINIYLQDSLLYAKIIAISDPLKRGSLYFM